MVAIVANTLAVSVDILIGSLRILITRAEMQPTVPRDICGHLLTVDIRINHLGSRVI